MLWWKWTLTFASQSTRRSRRDGFRVQGRFSGFGIWGLGFGVRGLGFWFFLESSSFDRWFLGLGLQACYGKPCALSLKL